MTFLLDTNACIAVINGRPAAVRERLRRASDDGAVLAVSSVSLFELWYGVAKSARVNDNSERLAVFLAPLETLPFDDEDARHAGVLRAELERAGTPIGAYDCLIAGQAVRHVVTLVTANVNEFERVSDLRFENWES